MVTLWLLTISVDMQQPFNLEFLVLYCSSLWLVAENCSKNKIGNFFFLFLFLFSHAFFLFFCFFFFSIFLFLYKSWPLPLRTQDEEYGGPTASFPVILGDFGCDVTCKTCWENSPRKNSRYRTRFEASSWIARPGLGTRLDLLLFPLALPPFGCVCNQAYYIW